MFFCEVGVSKKYKSRITIYTKKVCEQRNITIYIVKIIGK